MTITKEKGLDTSLHDYLKQLKSSAKDNTKSMENIILFSTILDSIFEQARIKYKRKEINETEYDKLIEEGWRIYNSLKDTL